MRIGHVIGGRFRIKGLAGSGGMGRVYRALDESTGKDVALKVLSLDASKYSRRFMREAKVMSELCHPNIVGYVEYGETAKGAPFIVMEWVSGEDLRQRMNRKKLELSEARDIIANVGGALAFAHRRGVIHRDLKPSNLMMVEGDIERIKLLDFGIARWRGPGAEKMTRTGISIGTPGYMAPEQSRGDKEIDGRADIYALGCVIYECLVGRRPFHGEDIVAVLARTALDEPPRISDERNDISVEFDDLLADMMATNVERRPDNGDVMAERARAILSATKQRPSAPEGLSDQEKELLGILLVAVGSDQDSLDADPLIVDTLARAGGEHFAVDTGTTVVTFRNDKGSATDLATRSARCALELRYLLPTARLALATCQGEVSGRRALTKTIQSAAQLLRMAEGGPVPENRPLTIRLDETTCRLIDSRFDIRRRRNDTSGGFDLLGERQAQAGAPRSTSQCIGREPELLRITQLFSQTLNHKEPRSILLSGEPGIGKSRVCNEAILRIGASHSDLQVWRAQGEASNKKMSYFIVRQILHAAAGIGHGDSLAERRLKLKAKVAAYLSADAAQRTAEFLGELCDTPFLATGEASAQLRAARGNASLMRDQVQRAWEEFLAAASAQRPILIVLEDLHWGDDSTLQLMDGVMRNVTTGSWMVLAMARPELDSFHPALWEERHLLRMQLKGLTERASRELIAQLLGHKPDESTLNRLVRLSGGNAFYLEELSYAVQQAKGSAIPGTILALAQTRLNSLAPRTRWILRAASIFGDSFWRGGVAKLLGSNAAELNLDAALHDLVTAHFIEALDKPTSSEEDGKEFRFHSDLVREAAYSTLIDDDRDLGHRLAGEWLLEQGIRDPLVLSTHFELGRQPERATEWYQAASQGALDANDLQGAIRHAQKGLSSGATGETLGKLNAVIARALLWTGENGKASEHSLAAIDELPIGSDDWGDAAGDGVTALGRCGAFSDIGALAQKIIAAKQSRGDSGALLAALARSTSHLFMAGRYDEAAAILDHLPTSSRTLSKLQPAVLGHICAAKANKHLCDGEPLTYLRLAKSSAEHFVSSGDRRSAAVATSNVGFAHAQLGDYKNAERLLREVLNSALQLELASLGALARHNLGYALLHQGQFDEAWDMALIAIESFQMQGDDRMANGARVCLSKVHQRKGALGSAEKEVREALHGTSTVPTVRMLAYAQLASVLLDLKRDEQALECAKESQRLLHSLGHVVEGESFVLLMLAEAHLRCKQLAPAKKALSLAHASVLNRANRIDDKSWQLSFVEQVHDNARIVELAAEWNIDGRA